MSKIIIVILFYFIPEILVGQWIPLDGGIDDEGRVLYYDTISSDLYAGGSFTHAGGLTVNKIARWNGTAWDSLGSGAIYGAPVFSITKFQGKIFASSVFDNFPSSNQNWLYWWNGNRWDTLDVRINQEVATFKEYNNNLYLGGLFSKIGTQDANFIARYDGTNFYPISLPSVAGGYSVKAIEFFQGEMYVGGNFYDTITGINDLERWNGVSYEPFGGGGLGFGGSAVSAMAIYNNELYIAGGFSAGSGLPSNNIMRWDGNQFLAVGNGTNGAIYNMHVFNGLLYICGPFTMVDNIPVTALAMWDGNQWNQICSEFNTNGLGSFSDFTIINNDLYLTGYFPTIDSQIVNSIAKYHLTASIETISLENQIEIFPNPSSSFISIESATKIKSLKIFSSIGKMVENYQEITGETKIDISRLSKGIYILKFELENGIAIKKLIKE
jgi:hypothetical protein